MELIFLSILRPVSETGLNISPNCLREWAEVDNFDKKEIIVLPKRKKLILLRP